MYPGCKKRVNTILIGLVHHLKSLWMNLRKPVLTHFQNFVSEGLSKIKHLIIWDEIVLSCKIIRKEKQIFFIKMFY